MSGRLRLMALLAIILVAAAGTVAYVMRVHGQQAEAKAATGPATTDLASVVAQPHLVFRNTALGPGYGNVAVVPLTAPGGPRALTPASCDRVYAIAGKAVCLAAKRGLATTYKAQLLGTEWSPVRDLPLTGLPSRARLSRDGVLVATTTFVYGDGYTNPGQFSTQTLVTRTSGAEIGNIEQFQLVVNGHVVTASDKNLWGVTFADDDRFFATAASAGRTWLVEGSLSARRLTALREDAECPSLSPDGTRIAFKRHGDLPPGQWRLAVYDVRTGKETLLAETRSVDDQVEWLDNSAVLYGLPRAGTATATSDVWVTPAAGGGAPRVLVRDAWSPAVVR
ncbi:MAG: protein tolB [Dactylosporangium sp.]|nr:protein tolB [Dactylosporangium sp.]